MKYAFGQKLREIREKKNITLKEVAEKAGVSESLISQIERNKVSPAIETLLNIINVLDIDMEYLFSEFKQSKAVHLVKKVDRDHFTLKNVLYERLSKTYSPGNTPSMEAYYMEIQPGSEKGSAEYGHIGQELGIILEGTGELKYGTETYQLSPGDSLSFSSDIPHILRNSGSSVLKAYWIITPPKPFMKES